MAFSKTAVIALSTGCFVAGLGAAYLISRDTPIADRLSASSAAAPVGVDESEALVAEPETAAVAAPVAPAPAALAPTPAAPARVVPRRASEQPSARSQASAAKTAAASAHSPEVSDTHAPDTPHDVRASAPVVELPPVAPEPTPPSAIMPAFEELIVSADSVIGLQMETSVSSERARIEDPVVAQVTRDLRVGDRVAIPSGAKAHGEVTLVDRGGRMKDRARLGVRFTSIVLGDGTRVPIDTDVIIREGASPANESSAKIGGGALGGAILGGILGGAKGAIIGGTTGAGVGSAAVLAGGRNAATLPSGTPVTVRLLKPTTVTIDK